MAHFAQIDFNNKVTNIIVIDDSWIINAQTRINEELGLSGTWIQTSYNTKGGIHYAPNSDIPDGEPQIGYNFAGIGYNYDPIKNAFYASQPYQSWILNKTTYTWQAPIPYPIDGKNYYWDETNQTWILQVVSTTTSQTTQNTYTPLVTTNVAQAPALFTLQDPTPVVITTNNAVLTTNNVAVTTNNVAITTNNTTP